MSSVPNVAVHASQHPEAVRAQLRMAASDRTGAVDDMASLVAVSDYLPPALLNQVGAMLKQMGKTAEADKVLARLPRQ